MKGVNKILGFIACLCFSIQGMQQVPKSKFTDPLEGKIPPSLIHLANSTNSTGLGSQQSSLNLSIQLGIQEASQQNKSIPYGVLIQCLTKHSAMAQRINIVMTPIIEKLAQALNNDIEQIVALKNLSIQIEENQTLNEIFNREFQQWADTLIEGLTHFNNGKLVFQPSNGNIRRKMAWMINRYMRLHLVQDQYDAMVKSFMENKIPCFDEIYEYNNSYFWRPHKWIGYSIDFLSTLPIAFRQIKMTERPEFKKLKEIRDLYVSGNRAGAQAQVDQNDTNHQYLWNSLESKYSRESAQRDIEKLQFRQQKLERQQDLERNRQIAQELNINVQSKIISALTSQNNAILIDVLNETKNSIYANAGRYKYEINAEVDYQIQASLNGLPLTNDPKEFTFQLAILDHLLNDIQAHTAQKADIAPSVLVRSSQLLGQAVVKYFQYLAPTDNEISLMIDLAKYISDATIGSTYLSQSERDTRIKQFWVSVNNFSQINTENIIDNCAYMAARVTWAIGLMNIVPLLRNLKDVALSRAGVFATGFAKRFVHIFDQMIGNNPAIITTEGNIILNASKEAVAESRQLIQAFEGMKDNANGKVPREILDDSSKVVEKESEIESAEKISIGSDKPHTFTEEQFEAAYKRAMGHSKVHIFNKPMHNLKQLVEKVGSQEEIIKVLLKELDGKIPFDGKIENMPVNIAGFKVYVRGRVMDGIFKISTFFIR